MKKIFGFCVTILFFIFLIFLVHKLNNFQYVSFGDTKIKIETANTPETQALGLSGRSGLKEDEGMLFVFGRPDKYAFWMKGMNFAIDMIWLGEDRKVVYIKENATPESYPEFFAPDRDARYVLEVIAGFSEKHNLKEGDRVEFTY